jgi:hypothetical protein
VPTEYPLELVVGIEGDGKSVLTVVRPALPLDVAFRGGDAPDGKSRYLG